MLTDVGTVLTQLLLQNSGIPLSESTALFSVEHYLTDASGVAINTGDIEDTEDTEDTEVD